MPIYDYVCKACGHELEALQNYNESPLLTCPDCKADSLKKRITAPAFAFKGGGWYKDLYGSAKKENASSKESSGSSITTKTPVKTNATSKNKPSAKPGKQSKT